MRLLRAFPLMLLLPACSDVEDPDDHGDHVHGLVTTVELVFTPTAGGGAATFVWADPENDGEPSIDPIVLAEGSYTLDVRFLNELEEPVEDVTAEIEEEADQHQVFVTGSGVESEATGANAGALLEVAYADSDDSGLPIGLALTADTRAPGDAELVVTLRHLPEEDGAPTKTAGLADDVAAGGFGAIGGDTDAQVTFALTVE